MNFKYLLMRVVAFMLLTSCQSSTNDKEKADTSANEAQQQVPSPKSVTIKTYPNDSLLTGFGYDIYMDSAAKPTVHQPNIPAVAGNRGFASEEDALKIGEYVANKIRNNIMPPSVTVQELDSLGVR